MCELNCPDYRGSAGEDTMRVVVLLGLSVILLNACATPSSVTRNDTSGGTGFVVSRAGHVLTNNHVARGCKELIAHSSHASFSAVLIRSDSANDLALLMSSFVPSKIASFRSGKGVRPGDEVIAFGFPFWFLASEGNVTTGYVSALAGLRDDVRYLQITTPVQPGNSGGPLLDDSGLIVGVVTSKLIVGDIPQNVNFAIKDVIARSFLEASGVRYESSQSARPITVAEAGATAREFTVRVECRR